MSEAISSSSEFQKNLQVSSSSSKNYNLSSTDTFKNDPRVKDAKNLFAIINAPPPFFITTLNEILHNPKDFKGSNDYKSVFHSKVQSNEDFNEIFEEFALDQIVKKGEFNPTQAFSEWTNKLEEMNVVIQQMRNLATSFKAESEPQAKKTALIEGSTGKEITEEEEELGAFDYLYMIIDQFIAMNTTFLELSMSYSLLLQNETEKQEAYLDVQSSLKPISSDAAWLQELSEEDREDVMDTWNQYDLPNYQQENQNYNKMSQDLSTQLNSMINKLTQASTKISDDFSSLLSDLSTMSSAILR